MRAIIDSDGDIIGLGETKDDAISDAHNTIMMDPHPYIEELVSGMSDYEISPALASLVESGADIQYGLIGEGKIGTLEEAHTYRVAKVKKHQHQSGKYVVKCKLCGYGFLTDNKYERVCMECVENGYDAENSSQRYITKLPAPMNPFIKTKGIS